MCGYTVLCRRVCRCAESIAKAHVILEVMTRRFMQGLSLSRRRGERPFAPTTGRGERPPPAAGAARSGRPAVWYGDPDATEENRMPYVGTEPAPAKAGGLSLSMRIAAKWVPQVFRPAVCNTPPSPLSRGEKGVCPQG